MCRIFGFRSVMQSQVHRSLVSADNAFMRQSERHPDGWGVAYYLANAPHVIKGASAAFGSCRTQPNDSDTMIVGSEPASPPG